MSQAVGALPAERIVELMHGDFIMNADPANVSPASLDLTLSTELYEIDGLILPQTGESIEDLLPLMGARAVALDTPLRARHLYLVRLREILALPQQVYGYCNPKSSTGRLDMHVRVLADGIPRYDSITPHGYEGALWLAIHPKSFSVQVHEKTPLTQLRLFTGDSRFSELDLEIAMQTHQLVWHETKDEPVPYRDLLRNDRDGKIILTALVEDGAVSGYECIASPDDVLDVAKVGQYDAHAFFKPLSGKAGTLKLQRDKFYILSGAERIRIPPTLASEMVPMDERSGDFRSHYAGFLDPGWGWGTDGDGHGRPFTLEVRPFEDLVVRKGQPIAKITFECMTDAPAVHYDSRLSNYLGQAGPKLAKQFS